MAEGETEPLSDSRTLRADPGHTQACHADELSQGRQQHGRWTWCYPTSTLGQHAPRGQEVAQGEARAHPMGRAKALFSTSPLFPHVSVHSLLLLQRAGGQHRVPQNPPLELKQRGRSHLAHRPFPLWPPWSGTRDVLRCAGLHRTGPPARRPLCPGTEQCPAAADAPSTPGEPEGLPPKRPASEAKALRKALGTLEWCCLTSSKTPFGSERPTIKAWKITKWH